VQLPGGALPVALSDSLRALRARRLVEETISVGSCFGGDVECVSVHSALAHAEAEGVDAVVCSIGPGIVGTGTSLGPGGAAGGVPSGARGLVRARPRPPVAVLGSGSPARHRRLSHHTSAVLGLRGISFRSAWPAGCPVDASVAGAEVVDVGDWRDLCDGLSLSHMGRGPDEDPWFFAAAFAAGRLALRLVR